MKSAAQLGWIASVAVLIGALAVGSAALTGCSQTKAPDAKSDDDSQQQATDPATDPGASDPAPDSEATDPAAETADPAPDPVPAAAADSAKVSAYAPAKDLIGQVAYFVDRLESAVETEEEYNDSTGKIEKDSNTLIVIALGLGLHDEDNQHQAAAATLMKAAQDAAAAKDFASAKAAVAAVKAAAANQDPAEGELKWEKVATLKALMEQVPLINTKLKRYLSGTRFASKAEDTAGYSAVIAIIAQGTMADTHEAKTPEQEQQWQAFSIQMRDAAGAVNAAVRAQDEAAAGAAMENLQQSCEDCHAVFHKEEE